MLFDQFMMPSELKDTFFDYHRHCQSWAASAIVIAREVQHFSRKEIATSWLALQEDLAPLGAVVEHSALNWKK